MGMGREPSFRVFDPYSCVVFNYHLRCSIPHGDRPRPASFRVRCTPSVGQLDSRPKAYLIALLRMPFMVVSCRLLNTPRCVACYLDFSNCSIAMH